MAAEQRQQVTDEQLREGLENAVFLARALSQHCESVSDLVGVCELALSNDGQFRLLMNLVKAPPGPGGRK